MVKETAKTFRGALHKFFNRYFGKTAGNRVFNVILYLFFIMIAFVTMYPFLYVVNKSLVVNDISSGVAKQIYSFDSYIQIFKKDGLLWSFVYSVIIVIVSTVCSLFVTLLAAYPLSRKHLRGRTGFLLFIIFTMLFSGGLIPYYVLIKDLGLRDTSAVYVLVGLVGGFNVIIAKNFMQGISPSLEEAAKIDGANDYRILFEIFLPLSAPIIATIALWVGVGKWNDWMTGVLYVKRTDIRLIQNFLRNIMITASSQQGTVDSDIMNMATGVKMAAVVVGTIPVVVFYPFVQKYFVKGVLLGSVKE